jgi:hypothetical protein
MFIENDVPVSKKKGEAFRYQPYFDLRKNIAKVVSYYSMTAVKKGITLDIFVAQETPNYFQGNLTLFLGLLAQLLQYCIEALDGGEICIRVNHESLHQNNNCETELSITITTCNHKQTDTPMDNTLPQICQAVGKSIPLRSYTTLHHIKQLCQDIDGSLTMRRFDDRKNQYHVSLILQQAHPARMLYLV